MSHNSVKISEIQQQNTNQTTQSSQVYELNCESSQSSDNQYRDNTISVSNNRIENLGELETDSKQNQAQNIFGYYENLKNRERSESSNSDKTSQNREQTSLENSFTNDKEKINIESRITGQDTFLFDSKSQKHNPNLIAKPATQRSHCNQNLAFNKGKLFRQQYTISHSKKEKNQIKDKVIFQNTVINAKDRSDISIDKKKQKNKKRQRIFPARISIRKKTSDDIQIKLKNSESEISAQQLNTLAKVFFQRKKQNHTQIKQWNYRRIKALETHRKVIDEICNNIDQKTGHSLKNLETYQNFYRERANQQQKYLINKPTNLQNSLKNNQISQNVYISLGPIVSTFNRGGMLKKQQRIKKFVNTIRDDIIIKIFEGYHRNQNKRKLITLREQISSIKITLNKIDSGVTQKIIKLEAKFSQAANNVTQKNSQTTSDFYLIEQSYLRKCCSQIQYQLLLAKKVIEYCEAVIKQQKLRADLIKKTLLIFEQSVNTKQNIKKNNVSMIEQLQKNQEEKLIEQYYSYEQLLNQKIICEIKQSINEYKKNINSPLRRAGTDSDSQNLELSIPDFFYFFYQYPTKFASFNPCHLIIKQFRIDALLKRDGQHIKHIQQWVGAKLLITIDKFVHVELQMNKKLGWNKYNKPQFSMKIDYIDIEQFEQIDHRKHQSKQIIYKTQSQIKSKNEGESSQNQSQSIGTAILVKLSSKKTWKHIFSSLQNINKSGQCLIRFYCEQEFMEFQDYLHQFTI